MKKRIPAWLLLTLICVIAAGLLAATYNMTKPQIEANTAAKAEEARKALLPEATSFEYDEESNVYVAKNAAGEVIGYTTTVPTNGFGGEIEITVGVEPDGTITGISVGGANFSETAGLGARAKEAAFQDQFAGKTAPVALTKDDGEIDALTAATITSKAVIRGVNDAMNKLSEAAGFTIETAQVDVEELGDGWYAISLAGFGGDVRVELLVNDEFFIGQIVADVSSETPNYGGRIGDDYLSNYIGKTGQLELGTDVDAFSGATITSTAINKAVNQIMLYLIDPDAYAAQASAAAAALPDIESAKGERTSASAQGFAGPVKVEIAVTEDNTIEAIKIGDANFNETAGFGQKALEDDYQRQFIGKALPLNYEDVEAIAGATFTSKAVVEAINAGFAAMNEELPNIENAAGTRVTASAQGFAGPVAVEIAVAADNTIEAIKIGDENFNETAGFGQKALADGYQRQFIGKALPLNYEDVEAIAGATFTSKAVVEAINAGFAAMNEELPNIENAAGTRVTASAQGFAGPVAVEIAVAADNTIEAIKIGDENFNETAGFGQKALADGYQRQFIGKALPLNEGDVDMISGATFTSKAVVEAINAAFASMSAAAPDAPEATDAPAATSGEVKGTARGFMGDVTVVVNIENGMITGLRVDDKDFPEIEGVGTKVLDEDYANRYIGKSLPLTDADVEIIAGATRTCKAVAAAINNAYAPAEEAAAPEAEKNPIIIPAV
ncbi:MAG: RnfABCDGE type electron transport complex subunit G, partial [Clostridia bacterium]|nr:RnfABCDGE type electron transport complex subunit G [Clostridia bacterium]